MRSLPSCSTRSCVIPTLRTLLLVIGGSSFYPKLLGWIKPLGFVLSFVAKCLPSLLLAWPLCVLPTCGPSRIVALVLLSRVACLKPCTLLSNYAAQESAGFEDTTLFVQLDLSRAFDSLFINSLLRYMVDHWPSSTAKSSAVLVSHASLAFSTLRLCLVVVPAARYSARRKPQSDSLWTCSCRAVP